MCLLADFASDLCLVPGLCLSFVVSCFRRDVSPFQRHRVRAERLSGAAVPDAASRGVLLRGLSQRVPAVRVGALESLCTGLRGKTLPVEKAVRWVSTGLLGRL